LRALGVEAEYIRADVRHEDDVRSLVDKTVKRFGRLDVAVNTAGTEGKPGPLGPIETGMLNRFVGSEDKKAALVSRVPVKRVGLPEEIAQAIVFVASDKASFITGASIAVDGGKLAG
jgi:NAD(P)-dependent dehydrogenase (short-subunit alcohol dehydrogenase family)